MKTLQRLAVLSLVALGAFCARSEVFEYTFSYTRDDVKMNVSPAGEVAVMLKDCRLVPTDPGDPLLPVKEFSIRVPEGEEIVNWTVESGEAELLAEKVLPVFAPRPHKTGGVDEDKYVPATRNEALYGLNTPYPAKRADLQHSGKMRGVTIATFRVSPVWFVGAEKKLYFTPSVKVKIFTAVPPKATVANPAGGAVAVPRSQLFEDMINAQVVNPTTSTGGKLALQAVNKAGSGCDYLVITKQAFLTPATKLANFRKTFDGVTAEVVTMEYIKDHYSGSDDAAKLRACIKSYVQTKGTEYVVLAGDDRVVPIREVYVKTSSYDYYDDAPSDLYYSDLDGTWNANGNDDYGERNVDELDLYPDVIVGRLPMRTPAQLATYVDKVIRYEETTTDDSDIVRKVLWFGYTLWDTLVHFEKITVGDTTTNDVWCSVNMDYQSDGHGGYVKGTTNATVYAERLKYQLPTERHCDGLMEYLDRPFGSEGNDAEFWCRRLHEMFFRTNANWRTSFAFGSATSWDSEKLGDYRMYGTYSVNHNTVQDILNHGYHFAGLDTHGNYAYVAVGGDETWLTLKGSGTYYSSDVLKLTNRVDIFCTEACITGGFDLDGNAECPAPRNGDEDYNENVNFAEGFLRAPNGGSVVFVGCAREGYSYPMQESSGMASGWQDPNHFSAYYYWTDYMPEYSKDYVRGFWREVVDNRANTKIGPAFAASKAEWVGSCSDSYYHWLQLLTNLLGDPLITIHTPTTRTEEPRALSEHSLVTLLRDPSLEITSNSAKIHVAADGIILGESAEVKLEYSTASNFSGAQSVTVASNVKNLGEFSKTLTGLNPGTKYYVRGKMTVTDATNAQAVCTSPFSMSFTTLSGIVPPTGTVASSDVSYTTAKVTVTLADKGDEAADSDVTITLVVSKNSDYSSPVFNQTVTSGTAQSLTGLTTGTKYYVKATFAGKTCGSSDATTTFTTSAYSAPTCDQPPTVGSVTADGVTVTVSNVAWGNGSSGGEVKVEILSGSTVVATQTGDKAGAFAFTGLAGNTQYKVRVTLTGSNGLTLVDETQTFTTEAAPFVTLSAATATVNADGTAATLAVTVEDTNISGGTLKLILNGAEKKSWTLAKGTFSQDVTVTPGSTNTFSFVASGSDVTETASGTFVSVLYVGWFDVDFGDSGFVAGADWIANSTDKSGGAFTASDDSESTLVKGASSYVTASGEIVYTPSHASAANADVKVSGRVQVSSRKALPELPAGCKAAVCIVDGSPRVRSSTGWTELSGEFTDGAWIDYVFEFDYMSENAPRVRYTVGTATSDWLAIVAEQRDVRKVAFRSGSFGNFKAVYVDVGGDTPIELVRPEFVTDGSALAFGGAAGSETFSMTIANPVKGAYYTVFTSTTLEGTFTAEKASVLCDTTAATYTLTVDADTPSKFAKIVISTVPFAKDAPLPEK